MEELLPFTAALVVGQMMERERSCGTLKNILAVPVSFRRLLAAKLAAGAWRVVLYALAAVGAVAGGLRAAGPARAHGRQRRLGAGHAAWQRPLRLCGAAAGAGAGRTVCGRLCGGDWLCAVYGFCGIIATGHGWTALYPPTAGTVLLRFRMDPTPRELAFAALSLLASLGLAVALTACARDRSGEKREEISGKAE